MKIVVDTNIVFSALLKTDGRIAKLLISSKNYFSFYSSYQLKTELIKHSGKIIRITGYNPVELSEIIELITHKVDFINDRLIPAELLLSYEDMLRNIDIDDTVFVALADYLKANLWTGDKKLISGLKRQNFSNVISTSGLYSEFLKLESQQR
ncbi:MAG: hypothetical protein FJY07_07335 [Bacteroidetes bacterium]|nr:hypothetical protein [Bacteroidota bacterium]